MSKSKAAKIVKMHQEIDQLRSALDDEKLDAERWRYARQHSYIEVRCDSPRVDGWTPELLDQAIDQARLSPVEPAEPLVWLLPNDPPLVYTPTTLNQDWDEQTNPLVCPKCNADRLKSPCQSAHWQICPMVGTALTALAHV